MPGPPNKWVAQPITASTTSTAMLNYLNGGSPTAPFTDAFVAQCGDGLFLFLGSYSS